MDVTIAPPGIPTSGFQFLSVNSVAIDGERFDTGTGTLMGPTAGTGVAESFDIMGTPVGRTQSPGDLKPGGNFPHQIVADFVAHPTPPSSSTDTTAMWHGLKNEWFLMIHLPVKRELASFILQWIVVDSPP